VSISTYSELKLAVIKWSNRSDIDLLVDDFIRLCEVDMFKTTKVHETLELQEMETTSTASVNTKFFALPDEYGSMRSVRLVLDSNSGKLRFKPSNGLVRRSGTGQPNYFTIGSQIEFDITPDQSYTVEVNYFKHPSGLSTTNTTNIILTNHPDIYLNGCLYFLFIYANDQEKAQMFQGLYDDSIDGANQADKDGRYGPTPYGRVEGATP